MTVHEPDGCASCQGWRWAVVLDLGTCIHAPQPDGRCELCLCRIYPQVDKPVEKP